jgi:glucose/arabinose dehydrogenase
VLRWLKRFLIGIATLLAALVVIAAVYLYFHPVAIGDPRMLLNAAIGKSIASPSGQTVAERLSAPPGFSVSLYARDLPMARFMRFTAAGDLLVSRPRAKEIVLLERPALGATQSNGRRVLLSGLNQPHGLDIHDGWLYIAENDAVGRVKFDEASGQLRGEYQRIVTGLSGEGNHWTKTVRIGPDGYMYLAQGSTCNVCEEKDARRATIMRFKLDGSDGKVFASGLRNSVGMDWAPWDNSLYATDNGRDLLGDDFPPCELNRIQADGFYGWPYINGFGVLDPTLGKGHEALLKTAISPAHGFRPHNAPLGITFLRAAKLPADYARSALVALHGSWNRSKADGYKVVALHWRDDGSIDEKDFLTGFERRGDVIGRPVDVVEGTDGAIYVSDDYAGAIYRVAYGEQTRAASDAPASAAVPASATAPIADELLASLNAEQRRELAAQGEQRYQQYRCAGCHEQRFAGGMRTIRPLENLSARYTVQQLQAFLATPTPPMPVFPLSDDERKAVAVYLLTRNF